MATWTDQSKNTASWTSPYLAAHDLLIDTSAKLYIGDGFVLNIELGNNPSWSNASKTSSSWTNQTMN